MKMIRIFIAIFVSIFLVTMTVACNNEETNDDTNSVNVDKATFTDETLEYTGEPLAIVVKNLPGGVKVDYTYSLNGEEVSQTLPTERADSSVLSALFSLWKDVFP